MSDKRKRNVTDGRNKRRWLSLAEKLDIIKSYEKCRSFVKIAYERGMNESSVRSIIKKRDLYKEVGKATASSMSKNITKQRSALMCNMEHLLIIWIEDCNQKRIPVTERMIAAKAMSLHKALKANGNVGDVEEFTASRGWLFRFKRRAGLSNSRIPNQIGSVDNDSVSKFPVEFIKIIEDGGYNLDQIFNVDETELFWKKLPSKMSSTNGEAAQNETHASDRLTILFGGNASGNLKLKPMIVGAEEHDTALVGHLSPKLPVTVLSNAKARVTRELFEEWFKAYFCPVVKGYCHDNNIGFHILLLLDSASMHSPVISNIDPNTRLVFLPPNTSTILQPMDQGVVTLLKANYMKQVFSQAKNGSVQKNIPSMADFWTNYSIGDAVDNVVKSWEHLSDNEMKAAWKPVLPNLINSSADFKKEMQKVTEEIVQMGKLLGVDDLNCVDVRESIDALSDELDDESLLQVAQQKAYEEERGKLGGEEVPLTVRRGRPRKNNVDLESKPSVNIYAPSKAPQSTPERGTSEVPTTPTEFEPPVTSPKSNQNHTSELEKILRTISQRLSASSEEDEFDHYGKFIAAKVRNMDQIQGVFAQKLINEVIFEGEMGTLSRKTAFHLA